ncbi:MAG: calcium/sodium antiporter [Thiotrichales bacterium]
MLANLALFVFGLILLVVGAEALVRGASRLALSFGVSPLVVGLTVVAFGTSAPEMAVSAGAALQGQPDLAIGNVVGSNIANVLLILGMSALITPLVVNVQVIRQEVPIMIGASLLLIALAWDGELGRIESAAMLLLVVLYTGFLIRQSRRATAAARAEFADAMPSATSRWDQRPGMQILLVVVGLALLVLGAQWLVDAAVAFARALGVSDLVIGLTVVAVGTSLPEFATSILAAIRGERDIAVGNVVGSNIFNILAVLGVTGLVSSAGLPVSETALRFDLWVMLAVAIACLPVFISGREIARWEGAVFLGYYLGYTALLVLAAQQHPALPTFKLAMLVFVLPLTLLALAVSLHRHQRSAP